VNHPHDGPCPRCKGTVWHYLETLGRDELVWCVWCGYRLRVPATGCTSVVDFVFKTGRFAGLTLEETAREPNGMRYLEAVRGHDKRVAGVP